MRAVKRLGTIKVGSIGDIDILVANVKTHTVFVIECKDIAFAKTPYEMGQQIGQLYDPDLTQKSAVSQALKKAEWIKANLGGALAKLEVVGRSSRWEVASLVVLDQHMMTARLANAPIPIIALPDLMDYIRTGRR
jgi:hypothetical protein